MRQVPIPPEFIPEGGVLSPTGMSYTDAWKLPLAMDDAAPAQGENGTAPPLAFVVRFNHLFELDRNDVQAMAGNGWRFWIRQGPPIPNGSILMVEPLVPIIRPYPFLDSDIQDDPGP